MSNNKYTEATIMAKEGYEAKVGLEALSRAGKNIQLKILKIVRLQKYYRNITFLLQFQVFSNTFKRLFQKNEIASLTY